MPNPTTPQNFSGRAGSALPGRVRRALDAHTESKQRFGNTTEVSPEGRLEVKLSRNSGLKMTKDGLTLDAININGSTIQDVKTFAVKDPDSSPGSANSLAEDLIANTIPSIEEQIGKLEDKMNELLGALRRIGNR